MTASSKISIERWRTAIRRKRCSRPIKLALRDAVLGHGLSFFDYGCGYGEDIKYVARQGIAASGFDAHFSPQSPKQSAHVVNLGYVINVIENQCERLAVLKDSFKLAKTCLIVAAQGPKAMASHALVFGDGYLTSRNTFQKYYRQKELQSLLNKTLNTTSYPAGAGVFYVFKDKLARDLYLISKAKKFTGYTEVKRLLSKLRNNRTISQAISNSPLGKKLPYTLYVHYSAVPYLPIVLRHYIACGQTMVTDIAGEGDTVVKLTQKAISFLRYREFDDSPHPELICSHIVDTENCKVHFRDYSRSDNPPILHRKETFVAKNYPRYQAFRKLTISEEKLGLLNRNDIGYRQNWQKLIDTIPHYSA